MKGMQPYEMDEKQGRNNENYMDDRRGPDYSYSRGRDFLL